MISSRITITNHMTERANLKIFSFGEDNRVVNEGDLLLVFQKDSNEYTSNGMRSIIEMNLRGCDMQEVLKKINSALNLYELNKEFLNQPVTRYSYVAT